MLNYFSLRIPSKIFVPEPTLREPSSLTPLESLSGTMQRLNSQYDPNDLDYYRRLKENHATQLLEDAMKKIDERYPPPKKKPETESHTPLV